MNRGVVLLVVLGVLPAAVHAQPDSLRVPRQENHIALEAGYAGTSGGADAIFGAGSDASLRVRQRLYKALGIQGAFGALSLGEGVGKAPDGETYLTALDYFGSSFRSVEMRIEYLSAGPSVLLHRGTHHSLGFVAAVGIYSVKLFLTALEGREITASNKNTGFELAATYSYRFGNTFGLRARVGYHRVNTSNELDDLFHTFARGDANPGFFSFAVGAQFAYR